MIKIIGAGLFGSVCANQLRETDQIEILEKRDHIGGNCYTELKNDIHLHTYGAHIFHTKHKYIWDYVNSFTTFNNYVHKVYSKIEGQYYSLPFNMNTFQQLFETFGVPLPDDKIQILKDMFIIPYSEKQWNRKFEDIPQDIINRIPLRYNFNNDYFENEYQGIPTSGYNELFRKMIGNIPVKLNNDFTLDQVYNDEYYIYSGCIDKLLDYRFGKLEYRGLNFDHCYYPNIDDFQFNSVVNYPQSYLKYTRIIEHKHFSFNKCKGTWLTYEYPSNVGEYYPINDDKNNKLYEKYLTYLNENFKNIYVGGRLGSYKYLNMDQTIMEAFKLVNKIMEKYEV